MTEMRDYNNGVDRIVAIKKRLRMEFELARSSTLSGDEALLAEADARTHRRLIFIQRLPMRILMLVPLGIFIFSENKAVLMIMLLVALTIYTPLISLLGVYVTIKAESHHVNMRREYSRLVQARNEGRILANAKSYRLSIADRAFERRSRWAGKFEVPDLRTGRPKYAR
ncbi:hypothetical protein KKG90_02775 [Candidatus Bipolaricaulota bacterium]|nr:hypothetical protein [Candidatus Bipolaricaulota bacterium]